ncbi:MAG: hypothetical protein IPP65_02950 [Chlorobi bacterium]|nr:hypothetical protein [Chlorobiota bacterium]
MLPKFPPDLAPVFEGLFGVNGVLLKVPPPVVPPVLLIGGRGLLFG